VQRVSQLADTVYIDAQFIDADPELEARAVETSPYHIVLGRREDLGDQARTFHLVVGGIIVATASEVVP
jgi:riboflavin biosynthesis pyrimidine reductase